MTPLERILLRQIALQGPMSISDYMTSCLLHPTHGYYTTRDPLGASGDFVTAPEVSQVFGELIGLSLAKAWQDRGSPDPFMLVELGPGRGTLMSDALRATRTVPGFHMAMQLHLIETSQVLKQHQAQRLIGFDTTWHDTITDLPDLPLFLIANEFLDVMPIRQFLRDGPGWRERVVGARDETLVFGLTDRTLSAVPPLRSGFAAEGDFVEISAASIALARHLSDRILQNGGVALLIDYGELSSTKDTFQAVRRHEKVSPLLSPGECDLTAHVDFGVIAMAMSCPVAPLKTQGAFLKTLGSGPRHGRLARGKSPTTIEAMVAAHHRLTHPTEMGQLFKVLALYSDNGPAPPGTE